VAHSRFTLFAWTDENTPELDSSASQAYSERRRNPAQQLGIRNFNYNIAPQMGDLPHADERVGKVQSRADAGVRQYGAVLDDSSAIDVRVMLDGGATGEHSSVSRSRTDADETRSEQTHAFFNASPAFHPYPRTNLLAGRGCFGFQRQNVDRHLAQIAHIRQGIDVALVNVVFAIASATGQAAPEQRRRVVTTRSGNA